MKNSPAITAIVATPLALALIVLLIIQQGWAISVLWGWFVVPVGLPAIGVASAIGIAVTVSALRGRRGRPDDKDKWALAKSALQPWFCLAVGWTAKQFA